MTRARFFQYNSEQQYGKFPVSENKGSARWRFSAMPHYFFKNALNKSIGSGRNVVVLCSLAISRMVWR